MTEQTPQPPVAAPAGRRIGTGAIVAIVLAFVVVASIAGYAVLSRPASGQEVVYEKPNSPGSDPFTAPAVAPRPKTDFAGSAEDAKGPRTPFGGSGKINVCDKAKLIKFLNSHRAQKVAWTRILGVRFKDFERYVASLTPTILTTDVRVTNHGFKNGKAFSLQSILAAGTAVLVDRNGKIVTKCYCGNPLTPPTRITELVCIGCPPDYDPPPPCDDCYDCPDEEACPVYDPDPPPNECPPEECFEPADCAAEGCSSDPDYDPTTDPNSDQYVPPDASDDSSGSIIDDGTNIDDGSGGEPIDEDPATSSARSLDSVPA